jgi:hypothetical protein
MTGPNPNKQAVELKASLYWGLLLIFFSGFIFKLFLQLILI